MFFCDRIRGTRPHQLDKEFTFTVYNHSSKVNTADWNEVLSGRNIFLTLNYLAVLEELDARTFHTRYVIVYHNASPCGIIYFQSIDFEAKTFSNLLEDQLQTIQSRRTRLFEKYIDENGSEVLMRLLTCGNNIVSGEHAFIFRDHLSREKTFELVEKVIDRVGRNEKLRGKISAILAKDFYAPVKINAPKCFFSDEAFIEFNVEPNMIIDLPEGVSSVSDYLAHFSKKYRNRAKGILKLGEALEVQELSLQEISQQNGSIFELYEQVYDKAKFKLIKLPPNYFLNCKKAFKDKFFVVGFYLDKKLVAFCSGFYMPDEFLEAHYIGFDYGLNKTYELYQNILYKFIEKALAGKKTRVNLGRTASEIKSTVGAKPSHLTCYIRPQNTISKVVLKPFIQFLQPTEWVPRNPFRENELVN
ncbi:MAG: hypothetical protein ACXVPQ_04370 [Bacteroidia bacterium]